VARGSVVRSTLDGVDDQGQGAAWRQHAWRQHVVHGLGDTGFVRPVEGLTEGHHSVRPRCRPREVLGHGLDPADVRDAPFVGGSATFGEHRRVGVETDRLLEQVGESDGEDARSAASIEEPAGPVQIQFLAEHSLELRRVGRSPAPVVGSGTLVDRGVV
jgi:hypothetical protein